MSELYRYVIDYINREFSRRVTPTLTPGVRTPVGLQGLYGKYAYVHSSEPTVYQILNVNLVHDHLSGRRMFQFDLGVIEVWAYHPDRKDVIPLSIFGIPISYTSQILPILEREGYRLMVLEQKIGSITIPEENVYNIEHVSERFGDTIIIDLHGLLRSFGGSLPPRAQLDRILSIERENQRLRILLTNTAIQYQRLLNDYVILRETVDRLNDLVHTLYSQISALLDRATRLEHEVTRLSEELRLRTREVAIQKTLRAYQEMETMTYTIELPAKLRELRSEVTNLRETVRILREEVEKLRTSIPTPSPPSPTPTTATPTTTTAPSPSAGVVSSFKHRKFFK